MGIEPHRSELEDSDIPSEYLASRSSGKTDDKADSEEVEIIETPPILVVDLVFDSEDEVTSPLTLPQEEAIPMDLSEESHELARNKGE
jgi:hypothetical protein